jgi:hypothetical protein
VIHDHFMRRVLVTDDGCWLWCGATVRGYGTYMKQGAAFIAHRYAYEQLVGPIPAGLDLDHLCRVRACVNPAHLEPVTRGENLRRGYAARGLKSFCAQGHPFDEANTFQRKGGGRGCRTCRNKASRDKKREYRAAAKAARNAQPDTTQKENNHA